ncbi:MAG: hypothetical protein FJ224_06385 [Lentisphaerae bacterium]|nr:hypothetical protein [Lentisphaerota bacterium]
MRGTYFTRVVWRNAVLAAIEMFAMAGGHAVLSYFVARRFGPTAFGIVTLSGAIASAAAVAVSFGSISLGTRIVASREESVCRATGLMVGFQWTNALVILPVAATAVWLWPTSAPERAFILAGLAAVPAECLAAVVRAGFYGRERFAPAAALSTACSMVMLGAGLLALRGGVSFAVFGAVMALLAWARSAAALTLHSRVNGALVPAHPVEACKALGARAAPFFGVVLLSMVHQRAAVPMVRWQLGAEPLGLYGVAATAVGALAVMIQPVGTSLFPSIAGKSGGGGVLEARRAVLTLLLPFAAGVLCASAVSLSAGWLVGTFLDASYGGATPVLRIMAWTLPLTFVSSMSLRMLMASGRPNIAARILGLNSAVNIVANIVLIPSAGICGAAMAAVLSAAAGAAQGVAALARARGVIGPAAEESGTT